MGKKCPFYSEKLSSSRGNLVSDFAAAVKIASSLNITVWKNKKFTLTGKIIRGINLHCNLISKKVISRKFCQNIVRAKFRIFHTVNVAQRAGIFCHFVN